MPSGEPDAGTRRGKGTGGVPPRGDQFASRIGWDINPLAPPMLEDINNLIRLIHSMYNGARVGWKTRALA